MWTYTEIHSVHLYGNSDTSSAHENQRELLTEYLNNSDTFLKVWKLIFLNPFFFKHTFSSAVILLTIQIRL